MTERKNPERGKVTAQGPVALGKLIKLLEQGKYNSVQLAEKCGMTRLTVQRYCRAFHQEGAIHITAYKPDRRGKHTIIIYKLGSGTDVARPAPKAGNAKRDAKRALRAMAQDLLGVAYTLARSDYQTE